MQRFEFNIYAAYHQIELSGVDGDSSDLANITDEDLNRWIKVGSSCIAIYTARFKRSPVVVEFHEHEPSSDLAVWSHVAEASLSLGDQRLWLAGLWDSSPNVCHFEDQPGSYRLRAFYGGLKSVTDPDGEGEDHYLLILWPAPPRELVILKQYIRPA